MQNEKYSKSENDFTNSLLFDRELMHTNKVILTTTACSLGCGKVQKLENGTYSRIYVKHCKECGGTGKIMKTNQERQTK